jgi:hypothetical protein
MIDAADVSCVIVTRGNVDLSEIRESLPFEDVVVWDNSERDEKVFGRYCGAERVKHEVIAVQDDDAIIEDWPAILAEYRPGVITCNMGAAHRAVYEPTGLALVGFGAVFDRSLIRPTLDRYCQRFPKDELFMRECDRVFTALNALHVITVPYRNLPHEETTERMWREQRHGDDLAMIRQRIAAL